MDRAENASGWAQQAQDQTDQSYRRLNDYIRKELPPQLVKAFEETSQNEIACALRPLHDSVSKASSRIDSCSEDLSGISWNWRIMWLAVVVGIATVIVGAGIVRCTILDSHFEESMRYELWGRYVEKSSPKEKERIRRWLDGGKLDPSGRESKK